MRERQPSSIKLPLLRAFGAPLPPVEHRDGRPDWAQAEPRWIERALERTQALPSGGWYVLDASRSLGERPRRFQVAGRCLVAWRAGAEFLVAPNTCPHMGASLADGRVVSGRLRCPWHGLDLGPEGRGAWRPLPAFDDGVLLWTRLDGGEEPTPRPFLAERPMQFLDAVIRIEARCEPRDVIANRLDPWHGAHLHPYAFARLRLLEKTDESVTVRVAYRVVGPAAVEVDARFHAPDPRTLAMTIVAGEGRGSVVETHATPLGPGRTAIVEATLATSERSGFQVARAAGLLVRPLMKWAAQQLWVDDAAYAERLYELRNGPKSQT